MENISYETLEKIGYKGYLLPKDAPEKVLQFGEGNFLRAFVDRFFDMGNEATGWNGKVVMVQPISGAFGFADGINAQDDLYTVLVRGKENGNTVDESRVIRRLQPLHQPVPRGRLPRHDGGRRLRRFGDYRLQHHRGRYRLRPVLQGRRHAARELPRQACPGASTPAGPPVSRALSCSPASSSITTARSCCAS